jgi:ribosomal protein S12 methylthiotransferase accessory factor
VEKETYQEKFEPFRITKLKKAVEWAEENCLRSGNYSRSSDAQKVLGVVLSKISSAIEKYTGELFLLDFESEVPSKWKAAFEYLKSRRYIRDFQFDSPFNDEPRFIRSYILSPIDKIITDGTIREDGIHSHGSARDVDESLAKSIGEFLERFTLAVYREKDFLKATSASLKKRRINCLDFNLLAGFSKEQIGENSKFQIESSTPFLWCKAKSLTNAGKIMVPAQLIFWNYNPNHVSWRENILRESNSNGAAGHHSLKRAVLSGIYEIVQRDGFLIYWLNHQAPPRIKKDSITHQPLVDILKECERCNLDVNFFNTTTDLNIPSCVCMIFDKSGLGPKLSIGAGCEMDWDKALSKSLEEALGSFHWYMKKILDKEEMYRVNQDVYAPFKDSSVGQKQRLDIWNDEKMFENLNFFLCGREEMLDDVKKKSSLFDSSQEELNYVVKNFKSRGKEYEIIYYEAKHRMLDDLNYHSVRVVVPAFVGLYLNETFAPLGAKRLKEVPSKLGFKVAEEWNPWPHPFP